MADLPEEQPRDLPDAVVRYADHDDGIADVHLPVGATGHGAAPTDRPTVLLLHGGFWRTAYDRRHTRPMARAIADAGAVVVTPEYRRVGPDGTGGWPATGDDVRRVADHLPDLLGQIGVATGIVRLIGHSAGGHLALWLAATSAGVDRTVAVAPVSDLQMAIDQRLGSDAARAFLADLGDDIARADPIRLLDRRPLGDVVVVHGVDDDTVPLAMSRELAARHPWVDLREVEGDHETVITPGSPGWPMVIDVLLSPAQPH